MLPHLSRCCQISFASKFWKCFFHLWMWLTSVASTSVYKSCQSSCVSTILIIRACVWRRALCTYREFGITLVLAIAGVASSLQVLPDLFREEVLKILFPTENVADLRCLYKCVQKLSKFLSFDDLDHPSHVLSPPCDRCLRCQSQLQSYNRPVKIDFYHCNS